MSKKINKREAAKTAIIEIADYLAKDSILVSARFFDAVERRLEFLASMPEIGSLWESEHPRLKDVRVWRVDDFPNHLLFYRPISDGIELIFACHAARDLNKLLRNI